MSDRALQQAIAELAGTSGIDQVYSVDGVVKSVSEADRTCTVQLITGKAANTITCRLMATLDDGILMLPKVSSNVCVIYSNYSTPYISQYSELDKVLIIVGDSILTITGNLIKFNDGSLNGLVKVDALVTKLNRLENAFNIHTHAGVQSGGSSTAPTTNQVMPVTNRNDLENKAITHG